MKESFMKCWPVVVILLFNLLPVEAGTKRSGFTVPLNYEGGTLPLNQGKIKATIAEDQVVFFHGNRKVVVPVESITAISTGTDVRRRFGASVLGIVPLMHLDKAETYYVGLTWNSNDRASKIDAVLKLN